MNISAISKTQNFMKKCKYAAIALPMLAGINVANAQYIYPTKNTYISRDSLISPKGIILTSSYDAPSSKIKISQDTINASIVVDLNKNILYLYDNFGNPQKAYKIASGKKSTPTPEGIRKLIAIEQYPYKNAPKSTKRYKTPWVYGPRILILNPVNTDNYELKQNDGIFIHGTNDPLSIGKWVSRGCIRMDNDALIEVANSVTSGQYIVFMR